MLQRCLDGVVAWRALLAASPPSVVFDTAGQLQETWSFLSSHVGPCARRSLSAEPLRQPCGHSGPAIRSPVPGRVFVYEQALGGLRRRQRGGQQLSVGRCPHGHGSPGQRSRF